MNEDISYLIQNCIFDLHSQMKPQWTLTVSKNPNEDPLGWLYHLESELLIKNRMEQAGIDMELFDDIYFAICWEIRDSYIEG